MPINALSTTVGLPTFPLYTSVVGGLEGALIAPTTTVLTSNMTQRFACDHAARFFYCVDTSHNLLMWDALNPTVPPAVILTAAAVGDQIVYLDVALDNSYLVATTVGNRVLKILTASPYTVTTLAGSGTNASTDGTGTAAAFASPMGICVDNGSGLYAYVWDVNTGDVRRIALATGVVTTLKNGVSASMTSPISMAKSGRIYFMNNSGQSITYASLYGKPGAANVGSFDAGSADITSNILFVSGVVAGEQYVFRIRSVRPNGATSPWLESDPYTVSLVLSTITSSGLNPNSPYNTSNNATVDSTAENSAATVRVYGPGGDGSTFIRYQGSNSTIMNAAHITGLQFTTTYLVVYDVQAQQYLAFTDYNSTLADNFAFVGQVITCASTYTGTSGSGGSGGSGGSTGGGGGTTGGGRNPVSSPVQNQDDQE